MLPPTRRTLLLSAPLASAIALGAPSVAQARSASNKLRFGFIGGQISPTWSKENAKKELTAMATAGSRVARITFNSEKILSSWGELNQPVTGNTSGIKEVHEVLDHAKRLGMELWMNMNYGYHDQSVSQDAWLKKSLNWWDFAAKNFASKVDVLQVFNEATRWHYRFYESPQNQSAYIIELRDMIKACGDIFKHYNPKVQVTHNLGGYPVNDGMQRSEWVPDLDVISPALDLIAIDTYFPERLDDGEIQKMDSRLAFLENRYGKPTSIAEIGMSTQLSKARENQQRDYYKSCVEVLKNSRAKYIIFYSFRDTADPSLNMSPGDLHEATFGVMRRDGSLKPAAKYLYSNPFPR